MSDSLLLSSGITAADVLRSGFVNYMKWSLLHEKPSSLAGIAIALMIIWFILSEIWQILPLWPAGLLAWLAALLLVRKLSKNQLLQIGILLFVGILALAFGFTLGESPDWLKLLDANAGLLSMLAAVSFLRLLAIHGKDTALKIQRGMRAYWQTMIAVALFGAFINVSAPLLVADKLSGHKKLDLFTAKSIIRAFCGGPTWSPFFAGMAVVLTYVVGAEFLFIMACGLPFAILGLAILVVGARLYNYEEVLNFKGYPITYSNLWLPGILVISVLIGHMLLPHVSILAVISLSALLVTFFSLYITSRLGIAIQQIQDHIQDGLPQMVNELVLFLAAGVLAVGLQTLVGATQMSLPFKGGFDAFAAIVLLAGMVIVSLIGVHPIISIATITPLVLPSNPNPQLLAVTFVISWSLGACASPLSGLNLIFQGRYGIPSTKLAMLNWPYVFVMFLVAVVFLYTLALMI